MFPDEKGIEFLYGLSRKAPICVGVVLFIVWAIDASWLKRALWRSRLGPLTSLRLLPSSHTWTASATCLRSPLNWTRVFLAWSGFCCIRRDEPVWMSYAAMIRALSALLDISIMKKLFADSMKCPLLYSTTLSRLRFAAWLTTVLLWRLPTGRLAILCPLRLV